MTEVGAEVLKTAMRSRLGGVVPSMPSRLSGIDLVPGLTYLIGRGLIPENGTNMRSASEILFFMTRPLGSEDMTVRFQLHFLSICFGIYRLRIRVIVYSRE